MQDGAPKSSFRSLEFGCAGHPPAVGMFIYLSLLVNSLAQLEALSEDPSTPTAASWGPHYKIDGKNAQEPDIIREWLQQFKTICDEYEIPPRDIYNFDKSRFRIGVDRNQWIVTHIFDRILSLSSNANRESVTICETMSGDSCVLPPVVIVSGAVYQERWYTTSIDGDTLLAVSDTHRLLKRYVNVCDRKSDCPRTTPASHKICCIYPKKSLIATKLESRDHYMVENK